MFRVVLAGYEKTPFPRKYRELLADYEGRLGCGEENPFCRTHFDGDAGEYRVLQLAVGSGRGFYKFLGSDPGRFDELVALLVCAMFPRHLALCGAARVLKEYHR